MANTALAIDAMSGDLGPRIIVPSALQFAKAHPELQLYLVGQAESLRPLLPEKIPEHIHIVDCPDVVAMDESPAQVLRKGLDSSMLRALQLLKQKQVNAVVSAGNTGALMALAKYHLKTIDGINRPAICGALPSLTSHSYLLDMGANVDCSADDLLSFAKMATLLLQTIENKPKPTVALLNIGEEHSKGNALVKQVATLLQADGTINYIGFIEAHKLYSGAADIIVCDGFIGNIALKASEGVATYILERIKHELKHDKISKALSFLAMPEFLRLKQKIDPRKYNGASFLGLNGVVVKSHGHADEEAFGHALEHTLDMVRHDIIGRFNLQFSK